MQYLVLVGVMQVLEHTCVQQHHVRNIMQLQTLTGGVTEKRCNANTVMPHQRCHEDTREPQLSHQFLLVQLSVTP